MDVFQFEDETIDLDNQVSLLKLKNSDDDENEMKAELLEDEELYDKFIPTNKSQIEEYLQSHHQKVKTRKDFVEYENDNPFEFHFNKSIVGLYTPPENFATVCQGIYRSSFPRVENFEYLETLKLKSILCLIPEDYPSENIEFNKKHNINFCQIGLSGNKEPFVKIKPDLVTKALNFLLDPLNQPVLIHCNRGKHRTGCIVGCIRKLQDWPYSIIFDEYRKYAFPKERPLDQQFIEMFDETQVREYAHSNNLLPIPW